jgi:lipopolysaccharide/colanic/teichoic acid biosynthesis glycosyltransferase
MSLRQSVLKRSFDLISAAVGLCMLWPIIFICWIIARWDTGASGFFLQERVGLNGRVFWVVKVRTMRSNSGTTVTTAGDARITNWGRRFRNTKLDELPQLWNVLIGDMSLVGPRPDVPGYLDKAAPEWDEVRALRPGITGPATLYFKNEEILLAAQEDPITYNNTIIWPKKLEINRNYARNWSLFLDLKYIYRTIF